ncbi:hypothetical protein ACLB1E_23335 [Escherichia coli]
MTLDAALGAGAIHYDDGASQFINKGVVDAKVTVAVSTAGATESDAFLWNQDAGRLTSIKTTPAQLNSPTTTMLPSTMA